MINLETDSGDYHLITKGIELCKDVQGMTCEIGLRRGGGTKYILDALGVHGTKVHIAVDPYGNIEYEHKEGEKVRLDYTNEMRDECLANLYAYTQQLRIPFIFFNLEDTEFFKRFGDGVPVYHLEKAIHNTYSFVHLDGPHAIEPLKTEIDFFLPRTPIGGVWCFDDIKRYYDHDVIEKILFKEGFVEIEKGDHKGLYQKVK